MRKKITPPEPPADPAARLAELAEDFVRLEARGEELRQAAHDAREAEQALRRARLNGDAIPTSRMDEAIDARAEAEAERDACESLLTEKREALNACAREAAGMLASAAKAEAATIRAHEQAILQEIAEHAAGIAVCASRLGVRVSDPRPDALNNGYRFLTRVVSALEGLVIRIHREADLAAALTKAAPAGPLESLLETPDALRDRAEATARDWNASGAERLINEALAKAGRGLTHANQ